MRIFLAIEIPQNIKEKLAEIQEALKPQIPSVRWEKPDKLHLTLVFLGNVPEGRVSPPTSASPQVMQAGELEEVVRKGLKGVKGINVGFSEVGVFPKGQRPRVVLAEVEEGREPVAGLQRRLAEALSGGGFEFARLSKPHVTLGRFKKGVNGIKGLKGVKGVKDAGEFRVREIMIVESKLHPKGAIHTPIMRIPLEDKGK